MDKRILFVIMFAMLIMMPLVSAFEFDDVKTYDEKTKTLTITNCQIWLGICWNEGEKIAEVELKTPQVNYLIRGKDRKLIEFEVTNEKNDYSNFLRQIDFYDVKRGMAKMQKDYVIKYKVERTEIVEDFKIQCKDQEIYNAKNDTTSIEKVDCKSVKVGEHEVDISEWVVLEDNVKQKLPLGSITIGVFGEVLPDEHGELIPTLFGKLVPEWAEWKDSYSVGLVSYWDFEEGSGTNAIDKVSGTYNGTITGGTYDVGKIGYGLDFVGDETNYVDFGAGTQLGGDTTPNTVTVCAWIYPTNSTDYPTIYGSSDGTTNGFVFASSVGSNGKLGFVSASNLWQSSTTGMTLNQWNFACLSISAGTGTFYVNGASDGTTAGGQNWGAGANWRMNYYGANQEITGDMDELAVWNRSLGGAEIEDLYNGGAGIQYTDIFTTPPTITLENPANYSAIAKISQQINCSGYDNVAMLNLSLILDGSAVNTIYNASAVDVDLNMSYDASGLSSGMHNWSCAGYDDEETEGTSDYLWWFNVTAKAPDVNLITPIDTYNSSGDVDDFYFNFSMHTDSWDNLTFNIWDSANNVEVNKFIVNGSVDVDCSEILDGEFMEFDCVGQGITDDDDYHWNVYVCKDNTLCAWAGSNSTFTIDATPPTIYGAVNLTNLTTFSLPVNSTWIINATDPHLSTCSYVSIDHGTTIVDCNSTIQTEWNSRGVKTIDYYVNDTFGWQTDGSTTITIAYFNITATDNPDPIGEGGSATFTLNLEATGISSNYANTNASFTLNGVDYATDTKDVSDPDKIIITKTLTIPIGYGNSTGKTLNWNFDWDIRDSGSLATGSTASDIKVYNLTISDSCAGKYAFLNWSLYDEENIGTSLNITAPNVQNVEIDLTITSWADPTIYWEYSKTWTNNITGGLCVEDALLNYTSYKMDWIIGYDATDRVREFHYLDNGTLDKTGVINSLTTKTSDLYDLESADSTTFLFTYTDKNDLAVPNSIVHTYRKYIGDGIFREVERSKQDNNGETHVHLVEEDVIYYFIISNQGEIIYTSDVYNAKCLSTICELSLTGSATETNWSIYDNEGGKYVITPNPDTRTATVTFDLETIGTVNATLYEYEAGEVTYIDTGSLTATSGSIDLVVPLSYSNSTYFVAIDRDDVFIKSGWLNLQEGGKDYFGTFGAFLGGLVVLAMVLMAISEGIGLVIFTILALIVITTMELVELSSLALVSLICAGAIIIWKLVKRARRRG